MGKFCESSFIAVKDAGLNPCFGGFGWERSLKMVYFTSKTFVLILVLVDLGGKVLAAKAEKTINRACLNPCFGGFGWERHHPKATSSPKNVS